MTKFSTLDNKKKGVKKTIFNEYVNGELEIDSCLTKPYNWDNVLHLGYAKDYGDVFKVWDDPNENDFVIIFGEKGDEFDN